MQNNKLKYKPIKSETVKKLEALSNGRIFVPKWLLAFGFAIFIATALFFIASVVISVIKKPNGLYNESCTYRNCEKNLGLKCINKVCLCTINQFYTDKCQNLSTFGQICRKDEHCIKEQSLVCVITSKCECEKKNIGI